MIWSDYGFLLSKNKFGENSIISENFVNKDELFRFIQKKPFDNGSDFQYYPFKLFQEVLSNE